MAKQLCGAGVADDSCVAIGIVGFATAQRTKAVVSGGALGRSGDAYAVTGVGRSLMTKGGTFGRWGRASTSAGVGVRRCGGVS